MDAGAAHHDFHRFAAAYPDGLGDARIPCEKRRQRKLPVAKANVLVATQLADNLHIPAQRRGFVHKGLVAVQRVGQHRLDLDMRVVVPELPEHRQHTFLLAGIRRVPFRACRTLRLAHLGLLQPPVLLAPSHHRRVGAVKPEPHRDGHTPAHQHQKHHGLPIEIAPGLFVKDFMGRMDALGPLRPPMVAVVGGHHPIPDAMLLQHPAHAGLEQFFPRYLRLAEHPGQCAQPVVTQPNPLEARPTYAVGHQHAHEAKLQPAALGKTQASPGIQFF